MTQTRQDKLLTRGPMGEKYDVPDTTFAKRATERSKPTSAPRSTTFRVQRSEEIQEARIQLPILAEEQHVLETVLYHPVVFLVGETGSGKTTQVPQILFEGGFGQPGGGTSVSLRNPVSYRAIFHFLSFSSLFLSCAENPGMIGVTQPRRIAAISTAQRVAYELGVDRSRSSLVAHQVRYDATTSKDTRIKFMTDGVLLRELAGDFLLSQFVSLPRILSLPLTDRFFFFFQVLGRRHRRGPRAQPQL